MSIAQNAEPASWIPPRLHPFAEDVGSIIPTGFAAYARVFHPPYRLTPDGREVPVRWRDIAAANGRTIAEEMMRLGISSDPTRFAPDGTELWTQQTRTGSLPREVAERLAAILRHHTQTPDICWFGVWEGFGLLSLRQGDAPMFTVPERDLFLLRGPIEDVTTMAEVDWIYHSPNLWWPDDRAWCVATEIDFKWSYVGGSPDCIEQVLSDPELEAVTTSPDEGNAMEK
ncbi:MAG TPA: hypothetical protein VNO75_02065 [Gemmatimonadaceae bacterium]|nr:hypothetical protein [Gemmatimonadaceae bacterium]